MSSNNTSARSPDNDTGSEAARLYQRGDRILIGTGDDLAEVDESNEWVSTTDWVEARR